MSVYQHTQDSWSDFNKEYNKQTLGVNYSSWSGGVTH